MDFEKKINFSSKKPIYFSKKPQILNVLRTLFQSHSTANWLQFGRKINSRSYVKKNDGVGVWPERNWQTTGQKTSNSAFERKILLPYFKNGAK